MRRVGRSLPDERARGPSPGAEVGPPRWAATAPSRPGMLRTAPRAQLLRWVVSVRVAVSVPARSAAPSPSFPGNDFQSTWRLARLPRGLAAPQRVQRRGRSAAAAVAPVRLQLPSWARSARPSPAALLGTAVLTSPHPPPGGGAARRVGCGERGRGSVSGTVSACVCTRAWASPARGLLGTAVGSCDEPETELLANRSRGVAVNSRGRSVPSWAAILRTPSLDATKEAGLM